MRELIENARTLYHIPVLATFGFLLGVLDILGFPSTPLVLCIVALYCYAFLLLYREREGICEFLKLIVWLLVPCVKIEEEGEEAPYPASSSELNPLKRELRTKRRKGFCRKLCAPI